MEGTFNCERLVENIKILTEYFQYSLDHSKGHSFDMKELFCARWKFEIVMDEEENTVRIFYD